MTAAPVDVTNNPQFLTARSNVYTAQDLRAFGSDQLQAGVLTSTDFKVAQHAAGADKSVDVGASGIFNLAWVRGTSTTDQGLYRVPVDGVTNVDIASNSSGNPRLDQIVLVVADQESSGSNNKAYVDVVTGTPTTGATLENRSGAGALPSDSIRLADVLLASGYSTITNSVIRDRRPWARGAFTRIQRLGDPGAVGYYETGGSQVDIDSTNLAPRLELSGLWPVRAMLVGLAGRAATPGPMFLGMRINQPGNTNAHYSASSGWLVYVNTSAGTGFSRVFAYTPAAGSHIFAPTFTSDGASNARVITNSTVPLEWIVEELVGHTPAVNG